MRSFWISLIFFVLLMCSCKTREVAHLTNEASKESGIVKSVYDEAFTDTTTFHKVTFDKNNLKLKFIVTTEIYDKDTGTLTEKTVAEGELEQGTDTTTEENEQKGIAMVVRDSTEYIRSDETVIKNEKEVKTKPSIILLTPAIWLAAVVLLIVAIRWIIKKKGVSSQS